MLMNKIKYPRQIGNLFQLSFGEELGNTISHGVPALILLIAGPFLAVRGYIKGGWLLASSTAIFTTSLFLMFLASTLYHAMDFNSTHKKVFRILDHIMIYFAIAGTFTPVCLNVIKGPLGLTIVILQWVFVLFGILYKSIIAKTLPKASLILYLVMGWSAILLIPTLIQTKNWPLMGFIVLGGILYTIGVYFYKQKSKAYYHFIWHIFIVLAAISHCIAILLFI